MAKSRSLTASRSVSPKFVCDADATLVSVLPGANVVPVEDVAERLAMLDVDAIGYVINQAPFPDDHPVQSGQPAAGLGSRAVTTSKPAEASNCLTDEPVSVAM